MNILHTVESYLPSQNGMSEVVRQISERLVNIGHNVIVAAGSDPNRYSKNINGVQIEEFDVSGNWANGINGEVERYNQFLLNSRFDIITNFAAQTWSTDVMLPILNKVRGKKVLVPTGYSGLDNPIYRDYYSHMKDWLQEYDRVVYLSNDYRDVNFAKQHNLKNGDLIPNGAAAEEFLDENKINIRKLLGISANQLLLLHVAGYVGGKGHYDSIRIFSKSKVKNATLLFICPEFTSGFPPTRLRLRDLLRNAHKVIGWKNINERKKISLCNFLFRFNLLNRYKNRQVIFKSLARSEIVAAYHTADIFLFPSRIECSPIVLFEALASKTPFLSTDVGNAREISDWSGSGMILPTKIDTTPNHFGYAKIHQSAKMLSLLAEDSDLRQAMAESGFKVWREKFSWEIIAKMYEELYLTLLESR